MLATSVRGIAQLSRDISGLWKSGRVQRAMLTIGGAKLHRTRGHGRHEAACLPDVDLPSLIPETRVETRVMDSVDSSQQQ